MYGLLQALWGYFFPPQNPELPVALANSQSLAPHTPLAKFHVGAAQISCCAFSPDGTEILINQCDGKLTIFNFRDNNFRSVFDCGNRDIITSVDWSPDGQFLAIGNHAGLVLIYNAKHLNIVVSIVQNSRIKHCKFNPINDSIVICTESRGVIVWSMLDNRMVATIGPPTISANFSVFSNDGQKLALVIHGHINIYCYENERWNHTQILRNPQGPVSSCFWNNYGDKIVAVNNDNTAKLWDIDTGRFVYLPGHGGTQKACGFDDFGIIPMSAIVKPEEFEIWDISEQRGLFSLDCSNSPSNPIMYCNFMNQSNLLVASTLDGWVTVWRLPPMNPLLVWILANRHRHKKRMSSLPPELVEYLGTEGFF